MNAQEEFDKYFIYVTKGKVPVKTVIDKLNLKIKDNDMEKYLINNKIDSKPIIDKTNPFLPYLLNYRLIGAPSTIGSGTKLSVKNDKENDRLMKENDRLMKENDRLMKENDRLIKESPVEAIKELRRDLAKRESLYDKKKWLENPEVFFSAIKDKYKLDDVIIKKTDKVNSVRRYIIGGKVVKGVY